MVTWNAPATNAAINYVVWRQQDGGSWTAVSTVPGNGTFFDTGLSATSAYSYEVQSVNSAGASAVSAPVALIRNLSSVLDLPTDGMALWLMADGAWENPVGYLYDYSGNGNDAWQNTYGSKPTLVANAVNGKPVLHFNGTASQFLSLPNLLNGATAGEALVVLRATASTGNNSALWNFGTGYWDYYAVANGTLQSSFGTNTQNGYEEGAPPLDITQFHVYDVSSEAGLWQSWMDTTLVYSTNSNTVAFNSAPTIGLNANAYGNYYFSGDIAEIVIFNRALEVEERASWQQYFAIKYLLANFNPNGDGLTTGQDLALGLNPLSAHTNGNLLASGVAIELGLNPLNPITFYPNPNGPPPSPAANPPVTNSPPVITLTSPSGLVLQH
jgi:hypothetical protein